MENNEVKQEVAAQPEQNAVVECTTAKRKTFNADFFFATIAISTLYVYVMLFSLIVS